MDRLRETLLKGAQLIARTPSEAANLGSDFSHYIRVGLALTILAPGSALILWAYVSEIRSWSAQAQPTVPINRAEWKVVLREETPQERCSRTVPSSKCIAASPSGPLFSSSLSRMSDEAKKEITQGKTKTFWMGVEISPTKLEVAAKAEANQLVLGYILGSWEVWVDGRFYGAASYADTRMPVRIAIPMDTLRNGRPLRIAIKINNDGGSVRPDKFNYNNVPAGLSTAASSERAMIAMTYGRGGQNQLFLGIYSAFTFILFGFWMLTRKKPEYLALSLVSFFGMVSSSLDVEFVSSNLSPSVILTIRTIIIALSAVSIVATGASFARLNRAATVGAIAAFLVAVTWTFSEGLSPHDFQQAIVKGTLWYFGGPYVVAAVLALIQWSALKASATTAPSRLRMNTLARFSALASITGVWILVERHFAGGEIFRYRTYELVSLTFFTWLILKEYRIQERQLVANPVSKYHRALQLPERLTGAIISFDLKASEKLFSANLPGTAPGELVHLAVSHIWSAAQENGGVVLSTAGDSIQVFFEGANPLETTIPVLHASILRLQELSDQLNSVAPTPPIHFRAAISIGSIRPVWTEIGGEKKAEWRDANDHLVFLEQARLLESEKALGLKNSTVVTLESNLSRITQKLGSPSVQREVLAKHDQKWKICAWELNESAPHLKLVA